MRFILVSRISLFLLFLLLLLCLHKNVQGVITTNSIQSQSEPQIEQINGTRNYRIFGNKGKDDKPWFDSRSDLRYVHCVRPGKCEKMNFTHCLGSKIPYSYTSLHLTDCFNQEQIQERLNYYQALRHVPKCWAVIQPFLCAVFAPKCERIKETDMVYLPSLEMCKITQEPCKVLYNTSYFPEFLKCNETLFPSKCNNDVREMKFNITGKCLGPLVPAETSSSNYEGIEGCGIQCKDPLYTDDEHRQIHKLIAWGATICSICNFFVIATFFIEWHNANKYPALIVFYINVCFLISCLGWLAQFTPGSRDDIVCRKDGTIRHSEPSAGENLSCIVVFVLVYYFLNAAMVWFVFLAYAWHLRAIGNVQDRIDKRASYFHLVAWSLPLVFTITTMALSEVDGNSTVGICFVGYVNQAIRAGLLLGPLCGVVLIGGYFIIRGMIMLFILKNFANDIKSTSASNKIHFILVRMGMCAILTFIFIIVTIACHVTEFRNSKIWAESLRAFIICKISSTFTDEQKICKIENRPSVAILQLHLLCLFGAGIVMSSWCWTPSSLETWKRYIRKKCGKEVNEEIKMHKHKVIAQTWAKRKEFDDKGRLSITLYNTHTDPVGLNFDVNDLNSSATNEISSTWANYLPQFVKRRFALTGAATNSSSHGPRKSSLDSEISFSVRHVSVESRRNSVDSQVSVKIAEMKTKVARSSRGTGAHHQGSKHARNKYRRRDYFPTAQKFGSRRESSTSMESQVIALKQNHHKLGLLSYTKSGKKAKRRVANAGLDSKEDISKFLSQNSRLIFPFLQNQGMTTTSDEETSKGNLKIQDSRFDIVLKQHEFSDGGNDNAESGIKIEEYIQSDDEISSEHNKNKSSDLDASTEYKKQRKLEDILKTLQKSSSLDNIIINRNSREKFDSIGRASKNSLKSRNSRKLRSSSINKRGRKTLKKVVSTSNTTSTNKKEKENEEENSTNINISDMNDSFTSYSSAEMDLPIGLESSFSGISSTGGKPNSRTSKISCDVGIQTNSHEIATQTTEYAHTVSDDNDHSHKSDDEDHRSRNESISKEHRKKENSNHSNGFCVSNKKKTTCSSTAKNPTKLKNYLSSKEMCDDDDDVDEESITEGHKLLPCLASSGQQKTTNVNLSESEKLKMLLLPSK